MVSNYSDDNNNIIIYEKLLSKHGEDIRSLNWGSSKSQKLRFQILSEIGLKSGESVLDIGCGLLDFYKWLRKTIPGITYQGIDITPSMIEISQKNFPNVKLWKGDIFQQKFKLKEFDFIVASGIFVYRKNDPIKYMKKTISRMYEICKKGIAFNSLSTFAESKNKNEFYANPCEIFDYCKKINTKVVLRHDYLKNDFTVYLYKSE